MLTLILGRVFCGWICPLGCLLEYSPIPPPLFPKRIPHIQQGMKYYLLIVVVLCSPFLWHIEPLCLVQRIFCFILSWQSYSPYFIITLAAFVLILFFRRRWCQSLCPLGGLLSLLSRYKRIKRIITPACTQCGMCRDEECGMRNAEGGRQDAEGRMQKARVRVGEAVFGLQPEKCSSHEWSQADCLLCFRCQHICPRKAVSFCFGKLPVEKIDITRRGIIFAIGVGIISSFSIRVFSSTQDKYLIRPPGALPEDRFKSVCIRCGACTKVCISHGLVPDFFASGLIGLGSPRLVPRIGACEDYCNLCGQICPSGAIQRLGEDEKRKKKIGTAVIDT
ncbi:MAG: 4Fe-4S binding protein, partial [Candidatus Desantisbacteria bacterium]